MYKRYQDVLDLVQLIDTSNGAEHTQIINEICEYFHQNFADPTVMYSSIGCETFNRLAKDVREVLMHPSDSRFQSMVKSIPPAFAALIFPVAVMRYILRDLKANFNCSKCAGFRLFYDMYGAIVLAC